MDEAPKIDPEFVAKKWTEIAPRIDKMAQRIADPNDFAVRFGSSLFEDDKASSPYCVSQAVRLCLVAGVDHLHTTKMVLIDFQTLPLAAPFSLVRGALENFGAAFWVLHPANRNTRIERTLRWQARNNKDGHEALEPRGLSDVIMLEARMAMLDAIATRRGIPTANVRTGYTGTAVMKYAETHSPKSKPLLPWRLCSGYAHGRPWVYIGMSDREQFETTADPDVFKVELTTNPGLVLHPTLSAYRLMVDVVRLIEQRRR